jgi:flagellar hook-basal body complex protein FliE
MLPSIGSVGLVNPASSVAPTGAAEAPSAAQSTGGADFGSILAGMGTDAVDTLKASEASALAGLQGKLSAQEVVQSIMSAEETLQTVLAIRDKVVGAYQEISRMQI